MAQSEDTAKADQENCTDLELNPTPCPIRSIDNGGSSAGFKKDLSVERTIPKDLFSVQRGFWTKPYFFRLHDLKWAVPFSAATAILISTDDTVEHHLPDSPTAINRSRDFSNYGIAGYAGVVGSAYLWSRFTHNDHLRESAVLGGEAALNAAVASTVTQYATGRVRPNGSDAGQFFNACSQRLIRIRMTGLTMKIAMTKFAIEPASYNDDDAKR